LKSGTLANPTFAREGFNVKCLTAATKYPTGSRNPLSRRVIDIDSVSAFAKIEVAILCYIDAVLPHRDSVHRRFRLDQLISSPTSDFVSRSAID
jgi:hypothetical protein